MELAVVQENKRKALAGYPVPKEDISETFKSKGFYAVFGGDSI